MYRTAVRVADWGISAPGYMNLRCNPIQDVAEEQNELCWQYGSIELHELISRNCLVPYPAGDMTKCSGMKSFELFDEDDTTSENCRKIFRAVETRYGQRPERV
jgi:hypothetical protein